MPTQLFKPAAQIIHYTQRNNQLWPGEACFPTCLAMAIRNNGCPAALQRFCIDDAMMVFANDVGVGKVIAKRVGLPESTPKLNQWWSVMAGVAEWFLGAGEYKDYVGWREALTLAQLKKEIDNGYMVIVGTKLTHEGHVVCVAGYTDNSLVLCDPYGNPNTGYTSDKGALVTLDTSRLTKLYNSGKSFRALLVHADKRVKV